MGKRKWTAGVLTWGLVAAAAGAFIIGKADGGRSPNEVSSGTTAGPSRPVEEQPAPPPATQPIAFGVTTPSGPYNLDELHAFEVAAGKSPKVLMFSQDWASGEFREELFNAIHDRQLLPVVTWEPRDYRRQIERDQPPDQPEYALSRIINGDADAYITQWATRIKALRYPVAIRFAQQMNGTWFPWSEGVNGNQPGEYVAAWKHVRGIFDTVGATNALWVWSPNISYAGSTPLVGLYPGDQYVDWIGVDGYNGGSELPWGGWLTPEELYLPTVREIRGFTQKPLLLTEVASAEAGGSKAAWIRSLFQMLQQQPDILGFVWVEVNREADWRIVSSREAAEAFRSGVANPRFTAALPATLLVPSRR